MRIGVVAAHPDDEVLGCGGTISRITQQGDEAYILILGEGVTSRYSRKEQVPGGDLKELRGHARTAASLMGIREVNFGRFRDNRFDQVPLLDVIKEVSCWIEEWQPAVIYTHHPGDLNIDHLITFRAVLTATRPLKGCPVEELYTFEVPSSTEWSFQHIEPAFRPNVFVDITKSIDTKIEAMEVYTSERRPFPHPRSPEALRAFARRWGSVVGRDYAEAFELIRWVR